MYKLYAFVGGSAPLFPYTHHPCSTKNSTENSTKNSRSQIPLILAWSLTIHRSQACTLDYAICDLGHNIFTAGQAYVALSRVRSLDGLYLTKFYPGSVFADKVAILYDKQLKQQEPIEYI